MGNHLTNSAEDIPSWITLVIQFSPTTMHGRIPYISRVFNKSYHLEYIQAILTHCLVNEHHLYAPTKLSTASNLNWSKIYRDLYFLRHLWVDDTITTAARSARKHKINVFSRFRPNNIKASATLKTLGSSVAEDTKVEISPTEVNPEEPESPPDKTVVLPLHQRLAIIKLSHGIHTTRDAMKVLIKEGGWFGGKENRSNSEVGDSFIENSSTVDQPRDKPLIAGVHSVSPTTGKVILLTPDVGIREFSFDGVFDAASPQTHVYGTVSSSIIMDVMNGFNATVIVYGQTGSGKTHTMFGADEDSMYSHNNSKSGIVPRAMADILTASRERSTKFHIELFVSYVEVYGDLVTDLLRGGVRCGHSKVAAQRYVLNGAAEKKVKSMRDVCECMREGEKQKRKAATAMNERSTRAHSLLIIKVKQTHATSSVSMSSSLFLVDLGGSEQVRKSGIAAGEHGNTGFIKGENMREAVNINLGLLAIKKCIDALNSDSEYVPYQDSKLTMLLSEGLGGNCKTSIIVCASMDRSHLSETLATLRFGEKCAKIERDIDNKSNVIEAVLRKLDEDIAAVEEEIKKKERWVVLETTRDDMVDDAVPLVGGVSTKEVIKQTVLVGAEKERHELQELLTKRYELTGRSIDGIFGGAKVVGFGKDYAEMYGIGVQYDPEMDKTTDVERFGLKISEDKLPKVIQAKGERWKSGVELEKGEESKKDVDDRPKKSKLVYAGLSA